MLTAAANGRAKERRRAREAKDWQLSDRLRDALQESGVTVRDTATDTIWEYS